MNNAFSVLTGCKLADNSASTGGGVYEIGSEVDIIDCDLIDNSSDVGGGLVVVETLAEIFGCTIRGNTAFQTVQPIDPNVPADPNAPTADPNDPNTPYQPQGVVYGAGGGLYCFSSDARVRDCVITENTASGSGGGVYLAGYDDPVWALDLQIKNCLITDNRAFRDGGGISSNWYAEPVISNCTIADNQLLQIPSYGGGIYCSYDSNTLVTDSIFWANTGYKGSQIAVASGFPYGMDTVLTVNHSDVQLEPETDVPTALDLVLCIDTTNTMWDDIAAIRASAAEIVDAVAQDFEDYRIAVVDYRDFNQPNLDPNAGAPYGDPNTDYPYNDIQPFTANPATAIGSLTTGLGGGDEPASVYAALMHCIDHNALITAMPNEPNFYGADPNSVGPGQWRRGDDVARVIILIGDSEPHDYEPFTNYTLDNVVQAATTGPVSQRIFTILTGHGIYDPQASTYFRRLAAGTGAPALQAANPEQVANMIMAAIGSLTHVPLPVYVEQDSVLNGWDPNDNIWYMWDPNGAAGNISEDPGFLLGYYLSQFDAGQTYESNCVDGGSVLASQAGLGTPYKYTTRIDDINDQNQLDMGYHYRHGLPKYELTVVVVDANGDVIDPNINPELMHGYVDPNGQRLSYYEGQVVELQAHPDPNYQVRKWTGADGVPFLNLDNTNLNTVTMTQDRYVTVQFEPTPSYIVYMAVVGEYPGWLDPNGPPPLDSDPSGWWYRYYDRTKVSLIATPYDPNWVVRAWTGTDDDLSLALTNTVTIWGANTVVTVEFQPVGQGDIWILRDPNTRYDTIQDAIDDANIPGDVVMVGDGLYTGDGNRDLVFRGVPITVRSVNGPQGCMIDCEGSADEPHRAFYLLGPAEANDPNRNLIVDDVNFVIQGFTITGGHANFGGAIYFNRNAIAVVDNCIITGNTVGEEGQTEGSGGAGVYFADIPVDSEDANAVRPILTNCTITNNISYRHGGGIYCTNASPQITNCQIASNHAGGPYSWWYGWGPEAWGGGVYCEAESAPHIIDCLILSNSSTGIGGAIYLNNSPAIIRFCTIMYNSGLDLDPGAFDGEGEKGGIVGVESEPTINHCIIGLNYEGGEYGYWSDLWQYGDDLYNVSATFSCIENGDEGEGNISDDPMFTAGGLGSLYLSQMRAGQAADSPCLDAGQEGVWQTVVDDYNLGLRTTSIQNHYDVGMADMGFHYPFWDGPPIKYLLSVVVVGNGTVQFDDPNCAYDPFFRGRSVSYDPNCGVIEVDQATSPMYIEAWPGATVSLEAIPGDPNYRLRRWSGTDNDGTYSNFNAVSMYGSRYLYVEFERAVLRTLSVGAGEYSYVGIQEAIDDARDGDIVLISSGVYPGTGYTVAGKNITITGANPDNNDVVAATVIDCSGEVGGGIHILGAPGGTTVLRGITIINSDVSYGTPPQPDDPGLRGYNGSDNLPYIDIDLDPYGSRFTGTGTVSGNAAITVVGNHTVANCIIRNCSVGGGNASAGTAGDEEYQPGGDGGTGGSAGAAGIYIGDYFYYDYVYVEDPCLPGGYDYVQVALRWGGSAKIINCLIEGCTATAGDGADGGNGGQYANGGNGGLPGRAMGAGVFCDVNTTPTFINCTIKNCQVIGGNGGNGGDGGQYGAGGFGGLTYADPNQDAPSNHSAYGAGVYCHVLCEPTFINCTFSDSVTEGSVSGQGGYSSGGFQNQPRNNYNIPSYGAGVFCDTGTDSLFQGCTLQGNQTTYHGSQYTGYGGGIFLDGTRTALDYDPYSYQYGYSSWYYYYYYLDASSLGIVRASLTDCNFVGNSAPAGGGIYWISADVEVNDCNFAYNESYAGAGLASIDSSVTISRCIAQGNIAAQVAPPEEPNEPNEPGTYTPQGVVFGA
ncbi:MAG: InlB B-repeat-containing protein, partial [Planctomycetota bacterium]